MSRGNSTYNGPDSRSFSNGNGPANPSQLTITGTVLQENHWWKLV